jgi:hypothetical protein
MPQRREAEDGGVKAAALQASAAEIEGSDAAAAVAVAADARPAAAVRAGAPRPEGGGGRGGCRERSLQLEQRRGLVQQAWKRARDQGLYEEEDEYK